MYFRFFIFFFLLFFINRLDAIDRVSLKPVKQRDKLFEKAMAAYLGGNYSDAEQYVLKCLKYDSLYIDGNLLLYDISDELGNENQKVTALKSVISVDSVNYPLCYRFLADLYYTDHKFDSAIVNYEMFRQLEPGKDSGFVALRIGSCHFIKTSLENPVTIEINTFDVAINTPFDEYWPLVSADDRFLYFTRLIKKEGFSQEHLFVSEKYNSNWSPPYKMTISHDDETNVGAITLSTDGQWLFFTACGEPGGYGSCDIYFSQKNGREWMHFRNIGSPVNSPAWEAQPSVSADKRYLYFASNRKGGKGGMDIWRSKISVNPDGFPIFSEPENLGDKINTSGDDFSPYIHADGQTLFFASDGHVGMGGSDIFRTFYNGTEWTQPENFGCPVNSFSNDFGLTVSSTAQTAVFSSDREGSNGSRDLYSFQLPEEFLPLPAGYVKGFVFDVVSGLPLDANIEIGLLDQEARQNVISTVSEGYLVTLTVDRLYSFNINKKGYLFYSHHFNLKTKTELLQAREFDIYLTPIEVGQKVVLNNQFFDFDSFRLKEESYAELDQLILFLKQNPKIEIEISGHTDTIGTEEYNLSLSENRAAAVADYLKRTISENRISFKGYGDSQPVSDNQTERGRALNRRCEMTILKCE